MAWGRVASRLDGQRTPRQYLADDLPRKRASHLSPSRSFRPRFGLRDRYRLRDPPRFRMYLGFTRFSRSPSSNRGRRCRLAAADLRLGPLAWPDKRASTLSPSRNFAGLRLRSWRLGRVGPGIERLHVLLLEPRVVSPSSYRAGLNHRVRSPGTRRWRGRV